MAVIFLWKMKNEKIFDLWTQSEVWVSGKSLNFHTVTKTFNTQIQCLNLWIHEIFAYHFWIQSLNWQNFCWCFKSHDSMISRNFQNPQALKSLKLLTSQKCFLTHLVFLGSNRRFHEILLNKAFKETESLFSRMFSLVQCLGTVAFTKFFTCPILGESFSQNSSISVGFTKFFTCQNLEDSYVEVPNFSHLKLLIARTFFLRSLPASQPAPWFIDCTKLLKSSFINVFQNFMSWPKSWRCSGFKSRLLIFLKIQITSRRPFFWKSYGMATFSYLFFLHTLLTVQIQDVNALGVVSHWIGLVLTKIFLSPHKFYKPTNLFCFDAGRRTAAATPCGSGKNGGSSSMLDLVKVAFLLQSLIQSIPIKFHYHGWIPNEKRKLLRYVLLLNLL